MRTVKPRNVTVQNMIARKAKAGGHHTRDRDVSRGSSRKAKHKKALTE